MEVGTDHPGTLAEEEDDMVTAVDGVVACGVVEAEGDSHEGAEGRKADEGALQDGHHEAVAGKEGKSDLEVAAAGIGVDHGSPGSTVGAP